MSEPLICKISLTKLINNALKVKKLLNKRVKLCAVVKSGAYGHGLVDISSALYSICDYFAVSLASEASKLRIAGIDKPILLLSPATENTIEKLILNDITLSVSTIKELILIAKTAKRLSKKVKVHIAINCGMNRLGFNDNEVVKAVNFIKKFSFIVLDGAYSHLGCVEDKRFTKSCFNNFLQAVKPIKEYNKRAILHISSSGGLLINKKYQLSMVRVGLLLYGYSPIKTDKIKVEPIMKVYAKNLLSRNNVKGGYVGYGKYKCKIDNVSILRLGYADGFMRNNANRFENNLCMDLSAVNFNKNDYVLVMDNALEYSKKLKTIPYEILVSVTKRAEKEYFY